MIYKTRPFPEAEFCYSANLIAWKAKNKKNHNNVMNQTQRYNALRLWKFVVQPIEDYLQRYGIIESGFRDELVNFLAGGADNSKHKEGGAIDINFALMNPKDLFNTIVSGKIKFQGNNIMNYIDKIIYEVDSVGRTWVHIQVTDKPRKQMFKTNINKGKIEYIQVFGAVA